jgi:3-dehydroquinate synthase
MKSIEIRCEREYQVTFDDSWHLSLEKHLINDEIYFFAPESLDKSIDLGLPREHTLFLPDGESQKTIATFQMIQSYLSERFASRRATLVAIGGGATTDLIGFCAATYMRGINWIAVPTTVAGMVDAAIGGKTAINLSQGKNLVGAFHSPSQVIIDFHWLETLSTRDRNAGLVEALKAGFIGDSRIISLFENGIGNNLREIIHRAIAVKAEIVSQDFKESGVREFLNYGHTLGHAIERESNYSLRHGEAISIGLHFAALLSSRYCGLSEEEVHRQKRLLQELNQNLYFPRGSWGNLYNYMKRDKKRSSEAIRFVTLTSVAVPTRSDFMENQLSELYFDQIAE